MATSNDITLIVAGEKFIANKVIISEKSDYFKTMFSSGMLESNSNQVEINGISSEGFGDILKFMYGLVNLEICMENVLDILAIADYFLIKDAIKLCEEFLMSNVDAKKCSTVANIAECYSLLGVKEQVLNFIDENFWDISQTELFYKLTPEQIHHAVTADKIVNFSELDLLEAIMQWGLKPSNLTIEEKLKHVGDMLDHVRFYEISKKELKERLKIIFSENSSIHLIHEKITQLSMLPRNALRRKFSTRGLRKAILRIDEHKGSRQVLFHFIYDNDWNKLTNIPNPNNVAELDTYYRSVVLNNELYIIVNCKVDSDYSFISKFSHKTNNWETIDRMNVEGKQYFSVCEVDNKIYVVGGIIGIGCFAPSIKTAESYDPMKKTWEYIASLPQPRKCHASVNFANVLYISGGLMNHDNHPIASMMKYNSLTNTWVSCAPLLSLRFGHTMITYGHKIYVCGGYRHIILQGGLYCNRDIEEYDVANDSWRFVTTVPGCHPIGAITLVESTIYILPDYHSDTEFHDIVSYDVETNEWSKELNEQWSEEVNSRVYWDDDYHTMYLPKSLADNNDFSHFLYNIL